MKKVLIAGSAAMALSLLAGCTSKPAAQPTAAPTTEPTAETETVKTGFASAPGFTAHGDIVYCTVELTGDKITGIDLDEYYGIRSIGHIVNNMEKASDEEKAFVESIKDENKIMSEDGKYANWKYVMIDGKAFECLDAGTNLYKELGEGASIEDLGAYAQENTDWWCNAMETSAETGAILKVAEDGEEALFDIDGLKLAKADDLKSFYGGLKKSEGYTKNFNKNSGTAEDWKNSVDTLVAYILNDGAVSDELREAAHAEKTDAYLDLVTGATFGYPSIYVDIIDAAVANAQ